LKPARPPRSASTAKVFRKSRKNSSWAVKAITKQVIGRFAPSPTGRLHAGSLLAAVGSYVSAKHQGGQWRLRIEDLDPPRTEPGASADILRCLEAHSLFWDGPVTYQLPRDDVYEAALRQLLDKDLLYPCRCSRNQLYEHAIAHRRPVTCSICTGSCDVSGVTPSSPDVAWRLRTALAGNIIFTDKLRGDMNSNVYQETGDIVLKRRDGLYAYQLAVVVDDAAAGVTEVVRGVDLLDNTARQCWLIYCLNLPRPDYLHLPLITAENGQKLSKQNHAPALDIKTASTNLWEALTALGQSPSSQLLHAPPAEILAWACAHWAPDRIPYPDSSDQNCYLA